ncbi:hypothetical protein [Actinophytocola sp. KF-1]
MLAKFVVWLDDLLDGEGSPVIVKSVVGIMGFAVVLGAALGGAAVKAGFLVVVVLVLLSLMLILLRDRRALKRDRDDARELLSRYCDHLYDQTRPVALVKDWNQVATISKDGSVKELITIRAEALQEFLYYLRFRADSRWTQPHRYRRRVHVDVRGVKGAGRRGPSWRVTPSWLSDGRLEILAHLHSPVPRGTEIQVEVERAWPRKCAPLMAGELDSFGFNFSHALKIEHATYVVVLPKGVEVYFEEADFQQPHPRFSVAGGRNKDGRFEVTLVVNDLPADVHVGMRLQVKR